MERIMIIGCGGSGKTTLARQLGEITGLPVIHLDQIYWSPGNWEHLENGEFDARLQTELDKPRWIMDGNYNRTLEVRLARADGVVYLDLPRWVSLTSWLGRVIKNWGTARQDMAPGCNEWFDPEMAQWIWGFNTQNRQRYYSLLEQLPDKRIWILRNRRQVRKFLRDIEKGLA